MSSLPGHAGRGVEATYLVHYRPGLAGCWQAAKHVGEYSFLGCTVAPGFEFQDFEMLSYGSAALAHITSVRAELAELG